MGFFPTTLPVLHVQRHDVGVELAGEQQHLAHGETAVTHPQHTVEIFWSMREQYSHRISPVFAFSAKTSSLPVTTYMTPSLTSGEASKEYFPAAPEPLRRVIQAP